ncbi:MAG: peptidoglycan DD-metalloendopeptidase family protein [Chloroflexi bacterium]|nr:peptidoglycan DD-metalloendopeptidase family protein [Chloroflexota bacterium]
MERSRHLQGFLILGFLVILGGLYLWQNNQPAVTVAVPAATPTPGEAPPEAWQIALETQVAAAAMPLATPDLAATAFVPPTLPPVQTAVVMQPAQVPVTPWPTPTPFPTQDFGSSFDPTLYPSPTGVVVEEPSEVTGFSPPPEQVPLSPQINDHFWLIRPVDASANSASLFYYAFGSDGANDDFRVHHGIDIPNPTGEKIYAGGSGTVVYAGDGGKIVDTQDIDIYPSYGNVVVIEHDFGYRGQRIYTLYAHMAAILTEQGRYVEAGDVIGLIGGTGDVSGTHVHMEVRVGENKYFSVYNPLLWVAPFLGHGVVAGRVVGPNGDFADDVLVTLSRNGRVVQTTTTYMQPKKSGQRSGWHVVPDPVWQENFVLGDVPAGEDYEISVSMGGQRFADIIDVQTGTTHFVILGWEIAATPQAVD